jgi:integrase
MNISPNDIAAIKAGRAWINQQAPRSPVSDKTKEKYLAVAMRLVDERKPAQAVAEARLVAAVDSDGQRAYAKRSTWTFRRAALQYLARQEISDRLKKQDALQRSHPSSEPDELGCRKFTAHMNRIKYCLDLVKHLGHGCPIPKEARRKKRSKRNDLKKMPANWKILLLDRLGKYRLPYLVCAVTGCRPSELANQVTAIATRSGIEFEIKGAKVTKTSGQASRIQEFLSGDPLVDELRNEAMNSGGRLTVGLPAGSTPSNFSNNMAAAAKRLWPTLGVRVTPYMLRHQVASDAKAAGRDAEEVAMFLGHRVTATQACYGRRSSGGGGPLPVAVAATTKPKENRKPTWRPGAASVATSAPISVPASVPTSAPESVPVRPRRFRH